MPTTSACTFTLRPKKLRTTSCWMVVRWARSGGCITVNLWHAFAHHLALNWNLGEENTNTTARNGSHRRYFHSLDPYDHNIVVHTFSRPAELRLHALVGRFVGADFVCRCSCPVPAMRTNWFGPGSPIQLPREKSGSSRSMSLAERIKAFDRTTMLARVTKRAARTHSGAHC